MSGVIVHTVLWVLTVRWECAHTTLLGMICQQELIERMHWLSVQTEEFVTVWQVFFSVLFIGTVYIIIVLNCNIPLNCTLGTCQCMESFTGIACERLDCVSSCGGAGRCLTMHDRATKYRYCWHYLCWHPGWYCILVWIRNQNSIQYAYNLVWDANKVKGCVCNYGYIDFQCAERQCPDGDDPLTTGQVISWFRNGFEMFAYVDYNSFCRSTQFNWYNVLHLPVPLFCISGEKSVAACPGLPSQFTILFRQNDVFVCCIIAAFPLNPYWHPQALRT